MSIRLSFGTFKPNDLHWNLLEDITSPHLQDIEVRLDLRCERHGSLVEWEKVDKLLCRVYNQSFQNGVELHVSLRPLSGQSQDIYESLMEQAKEAWPRFCTNGEGVVKVVPRAQCCGEKIRTLF